jgi:hypothetical protein
MTAGHSPSRARSELDFGQLPPSRSGAVQARAPARHSRASGGHARSGFAHPEDFRASRAERFAGHRSMTAWPRCLRSPRERWIPALAGTTKFLAAPRAVSELRVCQPASENPLAQSETPQPAGSVSRRIGPSRAEVRALRSRGGFACEARGERGSPIGAGGPLELSAGESPRPGNSAEGSRSTRADRGGPS